jgi:hypothetical protein
MSERIPLDYTPEEFEKLLACVKAGQYGRMVIAEHDEGGDSYVIAQQTGRSLRFNRLRVVDDPQHARNLAALLLAWADREENTR